MNRIIDVSSEKGTELLTYSGESSRIFKVILYSYLILKKMNERITDS